VCVAGEFLVNPKTGKVAPMISTETYEAVMENKEVLDSAIIYDRDFQYNYVRTHFPCLAFLFQPPSPYLSSS
jgi:hypothetical protein